MEATDPAKAFVAMLANGRWAIFNPDGSRFEMQTYANRAAARKALLALRR